jgi:hypothetical protein
MRAKKLSRVIGFAIVVAAIGGIGASAWAGTDEQPPARPAQVVDTPAPSLRPATPRLQPGRQLDTKAKPRDFDWS